MKKYGTLISGGLLVVVLLVISVWILLSIKQFETLQQKEHENFAQNISSTAETFLDNDEWQYFGKILQLLSEISFLDYIGVFDEQEELDHQGDTKGLNANWVRAKPGQLSSTFWDPETNRLYVLQPFRLKNKPAWLKTAFNLKEYEKPRRRIVLAVVIILLLLIVLAYLGVRLFIVHRKLEETERTKENMIYSITHDAKQDLTVIQLKIASLLKKIHEKKDVPQLEKDLKNTLESADSIDRFLCNLNDQQHLGQGKVVAFPEKVDLVKILGSIVHGVEEKTANRGITIAKNQWEKQCSIYADAQIVSRIFKNILHNAIKFSPLNSQIVIEMQLSTDAREVKVLVKDQGPGIPEKDWEKIFEPYVQLYPKKEGMGLGLANARKLTHLMQGALGVAESELDKGTVFYVSLPVIDKAAEVKV